MLGCVVLLTSWRQRRWLFWRLLCAFTLLPTVLVAVPKIYTMAWLVVSLGVAVRLVPLFERHPVLFRRVVQVSFPFALAAVTFLWASLWVADRSRQSRSAAAPLPPPSSPNVLLIVDGLRSRPALEPPRLQSRYNAHARRTRRPGKSSSTPLPGSRDPLDAPSHAAMFTGRWMHELGVGWLTPLDGAHPTVAEFLGSKGYATAGFVANTSYCAGDSGLGRGFTQYYDYIFPGLTAFKKTALVSRAWLLGMRSTVSLSGRSQFETDRAGLPLVQLLGRHWLRIRSPDGGHRQSRASRLAQHTYPARAPFLRFLELLRCS